MESLGPRGTLVDDVNINFDVAVCDDIVGVEVFDQIDVVNIRSRRRRRHRRRRRGRRSRRHLTSSSSSSKSMPLQNAANNSVLGHARSRML